MWFYIFSTRFECIFSGPNYLAVGVNNLVEFYLLKDEKTMFEKVKLHSFRVENFVKTHSFRV